MNERIQELHKQAVAYALSVCDAAGVYQGREYLQVIREKFAELIVRDCKAIIKEVYVNTSPAQPGLIEANRRINQKYGIKQ